MFATFLGQPTVYENRYNPALLTPVSRQLNRQTIGLNSAVLPFSGVDIWNAYEISWIDTHGKPHIAMAELRFSAASPNLVESKSIKLYLSSFNQSCFATPQAVAATISADLSRAAQHEIDVKLLLPHEFFQLKTSERSDLEGFCLDALEIVTDIAETSSVNSAFLMTEEKIIEEKVFSHLLRSNCPVTNQPDWGSIWIHYAGKKIQHEGLLKYFISFREHFEFGEHCVERIFVDIMRHCQPQKLTVYARYTRRGGIDINPFRSNFADAPENRRTFRQ